MVQGANLLVFLIFGTILDLIFPVVMCFFPDVESLLMGWGLIVFSYKH